MYRLILPLALVLLLLSACGNSKNNNAPPNSEISIINASGGAVVSSPANKGAISMVVDAHRDFVIRRTINQTGIPSTNTDVTDTSDFNFSDPTVAAMDVTGRLTALKVGFTTLEVVYRDGDGDPSDDDKVSMDITVTAAP